MGLAVLGRVYIILFLEPGITKNGPLPSGKGKAWQKVLRGEATTRITTAGKTGEADMPRSTKTRSGQVLQHVCRPKPRFIK